MQYNSYLECMLGISALVALVLPSVLLLPVYTEPKDTWLTHGYQLAPNQKIPVKEFIVLFVFTYQPFNNGRNWRAISLV